MSKIAPAYIRHEDKIWYVDLEKWVVEIIEPDGKRRPALVKDGDFMDVLETGHVIPDPFKR